MGAIPKSELCAFRTCNQRGSVGELCDGVECDQSTGWGCVVNSCNDLTGACGQWPVAIGCDDDLPCTVDWCDYETGDCAHEPALTEGGPGWVPQVLEYGDLVIAEFLANPSNPGKTQEFVELYNSSDEPIDLKGLRLADDATWNIEDEQSLNLRPGAHSADGNDFVEQWCVFTTVADGLNPDGDARSPGMQNEGCNIGD